MIDALDSTSLFSLFLACATAKAVLVTNVNGVIGVVFRSGSLVDVFVELMDVKSQDWFRGVGDAKLVSKFDCKVSERIPSTRMRKDSVRVQCVLVADDLRFNDNPVVVVPEFDVLQRKFWIEFRRTFTDHFLQIGALLVKSVQFQVQ